ncbi:rRNA adenine N-6-methyltransferase family protein [Nocardia sp. NPDC048505]|uniref:rRNA adenine N-6-methyltransferase family protein n=1 Tax=unclassified Nocardia TaxID=2637762 RepID=UPI00340C8960
MAQDFAYRNYSHTQGKVKNGGGRAARQRSGPEPTRHVLIDHDAAAAVVAVADPRGPILEPEAGQGLLTRALARGGAEVTAFEQDPLLAAKLGAHTRGIRVVRADFAGVKAPRAAFAVVGGLTSARVVDWCLAAAALTSATLVIQAAALSGEGPWDLATVRSWPWFDWQAHGNVARTAFRPALAGDATIVRITRRAEPLVRDGDAYLAMIRAAFAGPDTVHAALGVSYPGLDAALAAAGVDAADPAGRVHPARWVRLHERLSA